MSSGVTRPLSVLLSLALASGGLAAIASPASAAIHLPIAYALTADDRLVTFQVETPGAAFGSNVAITGLTAGDDVVGIDVRPLTGELYALVKGVASDRLAVINPSTGAATQVGAVLSPRLSGTSFGVDFNPAVDRVRVVSDADQNLRFHPVNGGASSNTAPSTMGDLPLNYASTDPGAGMDPNVTSVGYENNVPGGNPALTPTTELYGVDTARDVLVEQLPPNNGTLLTVGALGVGDVTAVSGLDIAGSQIGTPNSYAVLTVAGADALYTINTDTGAAVKVGDFNAAATIDDLSIADPRFVIAATGTAVEGSSVTVAVTRVGDTRFAGSISYATANGTATAGSDYTDTSGTLSFAAGETSKTITVPTTGDTAVEGAETLRVLLSAPTGQNSTVGRTTSVVTIADDEPGTAYALTSDNRIATFSVNTPGTFSSNVAITGLAVGEDVVGIDLRPATGELLALARFNDGVTSTGKLYSLNPATGAATAKAGSAGTLTGTSFGFDVNPVPDRVRVVSDDEQNLRLNPDTGGVAMTDLPLNYTAGDANAGQNPTIIGAGYTNSVAGATSTTLYDIDSTLNTLVTQTPPNDGKLNTVGPLGVDVTNVGDLDIAASGNAAFGALTPVGGVPTLYRIDLGTGALTSLGAFALGTVEDLALAIPPVAKAGRYHPLPPTRLLDTRTNGTRLVAGADRVVVVAGQAGVPATGVSAVVLNVTSTRSPGRGNIAVYPTGQQPTTRTSNLNFERGENIAVQVQSGLGSGGAVSLKLNTGSTDVVVDVLGWYGDSTDNAGLGYQTLTPQRVLDTRTTATPLRAGTDQVLQLTGRAGVPAGAKAVAVNLTVTDATGSLDVQLYPGGSKPTARTSSINVVRGQTLANAAVATLGPDGTIGLRVSAGQVSVVIDVVGYYDDTATGRFMPVTPVRLLDTRLSGGRVTPGTDAVVTVAGVGGVPAGAVAGVLSVTGTAASNVLNVQVFPTAKPPVTRTSTLNLVPRRDIANLAAAALGNGGAVSLHVSQFDTHLVVDVTGYFLAS